MGNPIHRMQQVDTNFIDRSNVFIEVNSPAWRQPVKISVEDFLKETKAEKHKDYDISKDIDKHTLIIDKNTLKVKVNEKEIKSPSVFSEKFIDQNISYYTPPKDSSTISRMHMSTDGNYLYIWVGNRWKRCLLSEW